jgi:hypothetical protein
MAVLKGVEGVSAIKMRLCTWAAYLVLIVQGIIFLACAEEILLATQQPFALESGTTLVVEDVDPRQGKIWLDLYGKNASHDSAVLGLGDNISCRGVNLTVVRIYAGGEVDLVALEINGSMEGGRRPLDLELESRSSNATDPKKSPGFLAAIALMILAGYGVIRSL